MALITSQLRIGTRFIAYMISEDIDITTFNNNNQEDDSQEMKQVWRIRLLRRRNRSPSAAVHTGRSLQTTITASLFVFITTQHSLDTAKFKITQLNLSKYYQERRRDTHMHSTGTQTGIGVSWKVKVSSRR